MKHELAMAKVRAIYSWHNISDQYKDNEIQPRQWSKLGNS